MTNNEILRAIDASIKKWKKIVQFADITTLRLTCPLCDLFRNDCTAFMPFDEVRVHYCPVQCFTGSEELDYDNQFCRATSFYKTSVWKTHGFYKDPQKLNPQADNHMLSELYEIRRRFIASIHERK